MKFLEGHNPPYDLTFSDVFLVPQFTDTKSRMDVDLTTPDGVGTTLPLIVSNMTTVAGRRMAETIARRGGLCVLPQDIPIPILRKTIDFIKKADPVYETPITLTPENTIRDALSLINKRSHGAIIVVDEKHRPVGIFTEKRAEGMDLFTNLGDLSLPPPITLKNNLKPQQIHQALHAQRLRLAPIVQGSKLVGIVTAKGALRSEIYLPAVDRKGRLMVAVAVGINGDVAAKVKQVLRCGADIIVLDTAHGHQKKMLEAIRVARPLTKTPLVAGNVVTAKATADLIAAGADIVKVGVGPGAMCTTRMMTGVGRPQFSAVLECAAEARARGKQVWADGGVRYPRDVALALAAGASSVMFGSWWAGTYESAADVQRDEQGRLYKESFGMASHRAVKNRSRSEAPFELAKKELFEEGISTSRMYINQETPGAEDIIDQIVAGVRSACTYSGAHSIDEFHEKAVVGVQTASGYQEGQPVPESWSL